MNEATRNAWNDKLKDHMERLNRLVELNAPNVIILNEIHMLHMTAAGYFGEEYLKCSLWHDVRRAREYSSLCRECGNILTLEQATDGTVCTDCEKKEAEETARWESMDSVYSQE